TAAAVSSPRALSWFAYSTSKIEFLVTSPISSTMPISLYRLIVPPGRCSSAAPSSVASAPVTASGTASSTVNGCTSDSNCAASTMNTTSSATPKAKYKAPPDSRNSRESPASAVVLPGGSTRRASRSSESSASPWANGGTSEAESGDAVEVVDLARPHPLGHLRERAELHELAAAPAHVDARHVARRGAARRVE